MKITIQQSGYVSGDFLKPVAYAGEMNSRVIEITHPLFDNSFYQLLIIKENRPYVLGIEDGKCMLPPSLTDIACKLKCQFMALRKSDIDLMISGDLQNQILASTIASSGTDIYLTENTCDCYPTSSNDCSHMIFKSDEFTMTVKEGLNINGLTPIPPYEQLVDMYNNLNKAKLSVEKAKIENETISNRISEKLEDLQTSNYLLNLQNEQTKRKNEDEKINSQLDLIMNTLNNLTTQINENKIYVISYYLGEDELFDTQLKRHGETVNLSNAIPKYENKIFVGWLDKKNDKVYTHGDLYSDNKDVTLFAIWE